MTSTQRYDELASSDRTGPVAGTRDARELVRLATLAASSHNTQPWRFRAAADAITILPDRTRRCPIVDPDDAHLYRSLGCAAENLVHAASTQGLRATPRFDESIDAVVVRLDPVPGVHPSDLAAALTTRQCSRTTYDGRPVPDDQLDQLRVAGEADGVSCLLRTAKADLEAIGELVAAGNRAQLGDGAFRAELVEWIRFNPGAALRHRDGLAGRVNGQPPLPTPLGKLLAPLVVRAETQVRADQERLMSSAGVAAFVTHVDTRSAWVEVGRCFQRFALQADRLGIRTAFINQPIEVPDLRPQLEALLGTDGRAQLLVRFGFAPYGPYSLRRPVDDVLDP